MNCPLIRHVGKEPNFPHKIAVKCCEDLKNYSRHINKLIQKQTSKELENNWLRLKTSVECAHRLQLALVTASREVKDVHLFFDHLVNIINIVVGSSKRNDELQHAQIGRAHV